MSVRVVAGPLAVVWWCCACVYLVDRSPLDDLNGGDITGRTVGVPPGTLQPSDTVLPGVVVNVQGTARRLTTSQTGRFTLHNLAEGTHVLQFSLDVDNLPPAERILRLPINLPSRNGQRAALDLGNLRLLEPGSVRGRVTLNGPGNVADARVSLVSSTSVMPEGRAVPVDASGAFVVNGVGQGQWRLAAALGNTTAATEAFEVSAGQETQAPVLALNASLPGQAASLQVVLVDVPDVDVRPNVVVELVPAAGAVDLAGAAFPRAWSGEERFSLGIATLTAGGPYDVTFRFPDAPEIIPVTVPDVVLLPGANDLGEIFLTAIEDCGACQVGGGSSSSSGGIPVYPVEPAPGRSTLFNAWVDDVGTGDCIPSALPTLEECEHVGLKRSMVVPTLTSCTNRQGQVEVEATDNLNALIWQCDDATGTVILQSVAFRSDRGLRDLLDWTTENWRQDMVLTVTRNGVPVATSAPAAWWTDAVAPLGAAVSGPAVFLVRSVSLPVFPEPAFPSAFTTPPGVRVTVDANATLTIRNTSQIWLEGVFERTGATVNAMVKLEDTRVGVVRGLDLRDDAASTFGLSNCAALRVEELHVTSTSVSPVGEMVRLDNTSNTAVAGSTARGASPGGLVCMRMTNPAHLRLDSLSLSNCRAGLLVTGTSTTFFPGYPLRANNVDVQLTNDEGIQLTDAPDVVLSNTRVARAGIVGIAPSVFINRSPRVMVVNLSVSSGGGAGLSVVGSSSAVLRGIYAVHNAGAGVLLFNTPGSHLGEVTSAFNGMRNMLLSISTGTVASRALLVDSPLGTTAGLVLESGNYTLRDVMAFNHAVDITLALGATTVGSTMVATSCQDQGNGNCGVLAPTMPTGVIPAFLPSTTDAILGDMLAAPAIDVQTGLLFNASEHPRRVWVPVLGGVAQPGPCAPPADCQLWDFGLRASMAANVAHGASGEPFRWNAVDQAPCEALGGMIDTGACLITHALDYFPRFDDDPAVLRGLCFNAPSGPPDCLEAQHVGAFQGMGALIRLGAPAQAQGVTFHSVRFPTALLP